MRTTAVLFFILLSVKLCGQDIHFSQFQQMPLHYSPAQTGMFDGDLRFAGIQRTQWKSVTTPFVTFGAAVDFKNPLGKQDWNAGLFIMQDRAGDSQFNTFQLNFSLSREFHLSDSETFLAGTQIGLTQKRIDIDALKFDNQWNGFQFDPNLDPNEVLNQEGISYLQLNLGGAYQKNFDGRNKFMGAIGIYQWSSPDVGFYNENAPLDARFSFATNATIEINSEWDARPALMLGLQGKFRELLIGGDVRRILMQEKGLWRAMYAGVYLRTRDAGYLLVGMEYDQWNVGLSYDINYSDLDPASNGRGGFEFSIVYILKKFRPPTVVKRNCPDYL